MTRKNKNKLYTLSYFRKRLRDAGITSKVLIESFSEDDKRYWTISVDSKRRVLCTCFKFTENDETNFYFHFADGNQRLPIDKTIKTESMMVIIDSLKKIINN
jgi:hypothetical protein